MDGSTEVYAILGDPVLHSLSPPMHNAAFRAAGRNAVMVPLRVPAERLEDALRGLHAAGIRGINLTTPHKEPAVRWVRALTPEAKEANAINTLGRTEEGWIGHATDGIGFARWLDESCVEIEGKRAIVFGAGGAARSILPVLRKRGPADVLVVSRDRSRAQAVASAHPSVRASGLEDAAEADRSAWDLLIRCLPVAELTRAEERWWSALAPGARVLDLNYAERADRACARAREGSLRYEDGLTMLLHQGAASFEFWTGQAPSLVAMRGALLGLAGGREHG